MRTRALVFLIWVAAWAAAQGDSVTLAWNASAQAASYRLYWGDASHHYTNMVSTTSTNVTVSNLDRCLYFFAVTAVDSLGLESGYSDEVKFDVKPDPTGPVVIITALYSANATGPWLVWSNMPAVTVSNASGNLFLKLNIQKSDSQTKATTNETQKADSDAVKPDVAAERGPDC